MVIGVNPYLERGLPISPYNMGLPNAGNPAAGVKPSPVPPVSFGAYNKPGATTAVKPPSASIQSPGSFLTQLTQMLSDLGTNAIPAVNGTTPTRSDRFGAGESGNVAQAPPEKAATDSKAPADGKAAAGSNPNNDTTPQPTNISCGPTSVARATGQNPDQVVAEAEADGSLEPNGSTVKGVQKQLTKASGKQANTDSNVDQENIANKAAKGATVVTCFTPEGDGHVITANKDGTFSDNGKVVTREQLDSQGWQLDNVVSVA